MGEQLRKILLAEAKKTKKAKKNGKNGSQKMLKKLHALDDTIEDFIDELHDEIMNVDDNPMYIKKASQLLADMSKEYSEFIVALRAIVNAVDRKVIPAFEKMESRVRDVLDGSGNGPMGEEPPAEEDPPPEEEESDEEFVIAKKDGGKKKKKGVKEALEI